MTERQSSDHLGGDSNGRILLVYRDLVSPGGIPDQTRSLFSRLSELGWDIDAVFRGSSEPGLDVLNWYTPRKLDVSLLRDLWRRQYVWVAFIGSMIPAQTLFELLVSLLYVPRIVFPHGTLTNPPLSVHFGGQARSGFDRILKSLWIRLLARPLARGARALRALSEYEASDIRSRGVTLVSSDGFDDSWFRSDRSGQSRRDSSGPNFLFLGRLEPYQKGLDLLLQAIDRISVDRRCALARFSIVGPETSGFHRLMDSLSTQCRDRISVGGHVVGVEKAAILSWADYFLHTSRFEGMARAPQEALAIGIPVIATRESNLGDWVSRFGLGYTCELTAASISSAIISACENHRTRHQSMCRAALDFAESRRWGRVAKEVSEFLRKPAG